MRVFLTFLVFFLSILLPRAGVPQHIDSNIPNRLMGTNEALEKGVTFSWYGAASIIIDDGETSVLIDPFVSRSSNRPVDILLQRDAVVEKSKVLDRCMQPRFKRATTILVGHTHYDHVLDAAEFADCTKAHVYGSADAKRVVFAHGYRKFSVVQPGQTIGELQTGGSFTIEILSGRHGRAPLLIDPLDREVGAEFAVPAPITAYGRGEVLNFLVSHSAGTILHIGSAGIPRDSIEGLQGRVDVLLLSLVGRPATKYFLAKLVGDLQPKHVVPIHFDNLFDPIGEPIRVTSLARLNNFFRVVKTDHPDVNAGVALFDELWRIRDGDIVRVDQ